MSNNLPRDFLKFYDKLQGNKTPSFYPVANLQCISIFLNPANTNKRLEIQGDFIYVDIESMGEASIGFNNPSQQKIPISAGFSIQGFPIKEVFLENAAQDATINLWYGYGCNFSQNVPYQQTQNSVEFHDTGIDLSNTTQNYLTTDFVSNTPLVLLNPLDNPNGTIIWSLSAAHIVLDIASKLVFQVRLNTPANANQSVFDFHSKKDLMFQAATPALSTYHLYESIQRPYRIFRGYGIYATSTANSIAGTANAVIVYTTL